MSSPLDDALAPPWVLRRTSPVLGGEADSRQSLRSTHLPTVSPADLHSELGPRSLDPAALFGARLPSLFEARRRLLTSATKHDVRPTNRSSRFLAGTEASTSFLFFDVPRPLPCGSGDTARAALRPLIRPQCWFRPLAWVCPTVMPRRTPHHESGCPPACGVRIDVHGSKDRAKDASPGACDDHSCVRRVHTLRAHARPRSPPRRPPDIRCRRRAALTGGTR